MSNTKQITLILDITKNGVECKKPLITIFDSEYIAFPCGNKVGPEGKLKLTVPDNIFGNQRCIKGFVQCEECDRCGELDFEICLCEKDDDCESCSECVGGICTIIECTNPSDCGSNYDCRNCKCECDGFIDEFGQCVQCGDKDDCSACETCIKGNCVPLDCGDGVCDEGTCVDCLKSGDCDGENECCVGNECTCCDGYFYNPQTQKCEEVPQCVKDADCPTCFQCDGDGNCAPQECPEGYVCKDGDCVFDPCPDTVCNSGLDCGEDCGCNFDTNMCQACIENPSLPGCPNDCDTPCASGADCEDGCGCVDGNCVNCSNFDCPECNGVDGCRCNTEDECVNDDGCLDELTFEVDGCNLKANLKKNSKCQCEALTSSIEEVNYIERPWDGGISRNFIDFNIDLRKGFSNSFIESRVLELLTEEQINNEFPLSGDFIVDVFPVYEVVEIIDGIETTIQVTGAKRPERSASLINVTQATIANFVLGENVTNRTLVGYKVEAYIKDLSFESGCIYPKTYIYKSKGIERLAADLKAAGPLQSNSTRNPKFTFSRDNEVFRSLYKTSNTAGRFEDILYGPKRFETNDERGQQVLEVPQGEIIPLKDYLLEVDCSCDSPEIIENLVICDIEFEQGVHFEISSQGNQTCNNQLTILKDFPVCPVNQNLEHFGWGANHPSQTKYILKVNGREVETYTFENNPATPLGPKNVNSEGFLRGSRGGIFTQLIYVEGQTLGNAVTGEFISEPITSVSLEMNHDASCKKETKIESSISDPIIETECINGSVVATITENGTDIISASKKGGFPVPFINNKAVVGGILSGTATEIIVEFEGGCKETYIIDKDCCAEATLNVEIQPVFSQPTFTRFIISTSDLQELSEIRINGNLVDQDNQNPIFGSTTINNNVYTVIYPITETILQTVEVVTLTGCNYSRSLNLVTSNDDFNIEPSVICQNDTANLILDTTSPNTNFVIQGPTRTYNGTTNALGQSTIPVDDAGDYQVISFNNQGISNSKIVSLDVISSPQVSSINTISESCTGTDIIVSIIGTPNSVVTITDQSNIKTTVLDENGSGSVIYNYNTPGAYTFEATSVTLGECTSTTTISDSTIILQGPTLIVDSVGCVAPISATSDVDINVISTAGATVVAGGVTLTENTPTIFQGTIPNGSGESILITATLGDCTTELQYPVPSCECPTIPNPTFTNGDGNYTSCNGGSVNMIVNNPNAAIYDIEWYNTSSLTGTPIATASNYSTSTGGIYYVISVDPNTGCKSTPIQVFLSEENLSVSLSNLAKACRGTNEAIKATVVPSTVSVSNYEFSVNSMIVQSGPSNVLDYNWDTVGNQDISVLVTSNAGCTATGTSTILIEQCNECNALATSFNSSQGSSTGIQGPFTIIGDLNWEFSPQAVSDRLVIYQDGVAILDTGAVTQISQASCTNSVAQGGIDFCSCADVFIDDYSDNSSVPIPVGTAIRQSSTTISGTLTGLNGDITYQVIGDTCNSGSNTVWNGSIICV